MAFKYYPHPFVLPDGRIPGVSSEDDKAISSRVLDLNTQTWTTVDSKSIRRPQCGHVSAGKDASRLERLRLITGAIRGRDCLRTGHEPVLTGLAANGIDGVSAILLNLTILPDGTVLATGGSTTTDKANFAAAVYEAELWSPVTKAGRPWLGCRLPGFITRPLCCYRMRRVSGGAAEAGKTDDPSRSEGRAERGNFFAALSFQRASPVNFFGPVDYPVRHRISVATPDAARIASVSLIALGAVTHAFNENQRFVPLAFDQASSPLNVHAPANGNLAPPGPYMLFLVDSNGVPSKAAMVRLPAPQRFRQPAADSKFNHAQHGERQWRDSCSHHGHRVPAGSHSESGRNGGDRSDGGKQHFDHSHDSGPCRGSGDVVVSNTDSQSGTCPTATPTPHPPAAETIGFVQVKAATPQTASASVAVTYRAAQTAGNLNIVVVGWNDTTSTVNAVTDSQGNTLAWRSARRAGPGCGSRFTTPKTLRRAAIR